MLRTRQAGGDAAGESRRPLPTRGEQTSPTVLISEARNKGEGRVGYDGTLAAMTANTPSLDDLRISDSLRSGGRLRRAGGLLLAAAIVALLAAGWWRVARPAAAIVRVEPVVEQRTGGANGGAGTVLNASGYVTARRRATVSSKVTGKVREIFVEEGMAVREGQVLARLDDTTPRAYLAVTEAEFAAARRNLTETEVRLKEAETTLKRTRALAAEGISNQADLDAAQASVDAFAAHLVAAQEQVKVSEATVALRRADLDDTTIRAPFSGVAVTKDAQPGEMISPVSAGGGFTRTGICTIVDMKSLEIEVDVNESYIGRVTQGQKVEATLDAYPDWRIPARVITMVPTADRQKATVLVRIGFEKLDPRILPDMGVKVAFLSAQAPGDAPASPVKPRLVVPRRAVRSDSGQDIVFLVRDGMAVRRVVQLGPTEGERVEVLSGLAASDRVVVEGPNDLADGRKVIVQ
jgi:RND family efflux transporter MFP subunit